MARRRIITIDGPAGTGKSTVAHRVASRLGFDFLDTGAMYRAVALLAIERGIDPADGETLVEALRDADLHFDWSFDPPHVAIDGRDVSERIREQDVGECVSIVAQQDVVRQELVRMQRRIAEEHPALVTEGRDQGSVVFPDADVRFYIDARPEVRAERRSRQMQQAGKEVDRSDVLQGILQRDELDSSRPAGPLIRPQGAVEIDTSDLTLQQVVDRMVDVVRQRLEDDEIAAET